jgi:hypothetical protein
MTMYGEVNVSLHSFSYQIKLSDSRIHDPTALPLEEESQVSTEWEAGLIPETPGHSRLQSSVQSLYWLSYYVPFFATIPSWSLQQQKVCRLMNLSQVIWAVWYCSTLLCVSWLTEPQNKISHCCVCLGWQNHKMRFHHLWQSFFFPVNLNSLTKAHALLLYRHTVDCPILLELREVN